MLSEVEASPRHGRLYVILSVTKDLLAGYVILSVTKDLLAGYTLSTVIARLIPYIVIARLGTSRGNLLAGHTLSTRVVAGRL